MKLIRLSILVLCGVAVNVANAQTKSQVFIDYINKYKDIAIQQMVKHRIPASITLAQGLLESGAGNSDLAKRSNNHFGIKCGGTWLGASTTHFDDGRNECFRVYETVNDSYEDHSIFLHKERYGRLYRLGILDYIGWARGLKACGYASSPTYADRLINLIELYELNTLDYDPDAPVYIPAQRPLPVIELNTHAIKTNNGVMYVNAHAGDTWASLAKAFGVSKKKLLKFNDATDDVPLNNGDIVYLETKKSKASKNAIKDNIYIIQKDDSMYGIAQKYGITLKSLYKLNKIPYEYVPVEGHNLRLR